MTAFAGVALPRFPVQYHLVATDQAGLRTAARIAMGWPVFLVTSTLIYLAVRTAIRALPRAAEAAWPTEPEGFTDG